jgi:elongation factor P--beta-lysine ligase
LSPSHFKISVIYIMNTQENMEEKYRLLIWNYLSHKITFEEKKTLLDWLQQSEENRQLFSECKKIFDLTVSGNQISKFSYRKSDAFQRLRSKIEPLTTDRSRQKVKKTQILFTHRRFSNFDLFNRSFDLFMVNQNQIRW